MPYIERSVAFTERKLSAVLATPGVVDADKYIDSFSQWKRPDGRSESVQVVGFNLDKPLGAPWNIVAGSVQDLKAPDAVFIDELYREKLGVTHLGQVVEIRDYRARVVGFTRGIRTFTTAPYVFTSFKNALNYADMREDQTLYILVKVARGVPIEDVRRALAARLTDVDVVTSAEFSRMTRFYWMFSTGAGLAVLLAALLGLVVGVVVVAQTIYATTMDHIREYGTLKAIGATNRYLYGVIVQQAMISAVFGYAVGITASWFVVRSSEQGGAAILLPPEMAVGMFGLTIAMCVVAALVSIKKVAGLDPALVFKG